MKDTILDSVNYTPDHLTYEDGIWKILQLAEEHPNDFDLGGHIRLLYNNHIKLNK